MESPECSSSPARASQGPNLRSAGTASPAEAAAPSPSTPAIAEKATGPAPTARAKAPSAERPEGLTPEQRSLRARLANHVRWSQTDDRVAATAPARKAFNDRWEKQVDPDGVLEPRERAIRAEHAKKAHFARMAMASAKSRARKKKAA